MNGTSTTHRIPETDERILSFAFFCFPNSFRIQFTISDRWPFHRAHSHAMTTRRNTCKITMLPSDALAWIYLHAILSDISPLRYSAQGPSIILCCCPSCPFRDSISSLHVGTSHAAPFPELRAAPRPGRLHQWPPPQTHPSRLLPASCSAVCSRGRGKTVTWAVYFCWESFQGLHQIPFANAIKQHQSSRPCPHAHWSLQRAPTDFRAMIPLCRNWAVSSPVYHVLSRALNCAVQNSFYPVAWHRHQAYWQQQTQTLCGLSGSLWSTR